MDSYRVFRDKPILSAGLVAERFLMLDIDTFHKACRYVHELPYGYNSDRDDLMILFTERMGTCTTKHAVIAALAVELNLPVEKNIGIYAMTGEIVTGADRICAKYNLPYVPMIHCFLTDGHHRVNLTQGNANGKNRYVDTFLYTETVIPTISAKEEYFKYRNALKIHILTRTELQGTGIRDLLHAREEGLELLGAALKNSV
jgi:hypothetical protein